MYCVAHRILFLCFLLLAGQTFATKPEITTDPNMPERGTPGTLYTLTLLTEASASIPQTTTSYPIVYRLTNTSKFARILRMKSMGPAVTQLTRLPNEFFSHLFNSSDRPCQIDTYLEKSDSCILSISVNGAILAGLTGGRNALTASNTGNGPVVCAVNSDGSFSSSCSSAQIIVQIFIDTREAPRCSGTSVGSCNLDGITSSTCGNYYQAFGYPCAWDASYGCLTQIATNSPTEYCDPSKVTHLLPKCIGTEVFPPSSSSTQTGCDALGTDNCPSITTPPPLDYERSGSHEYQCALSYNSGYGSYCSYGATCRP